MRERSEGAAALLPAGRIAQLFSISIRPAAAGLGDKGCGNLSASGLYPAPADAMP
jgi:hypothetical protein